MVLGQFEPNSDRTDMLWLKRRHWPSMSANDATVSLIEMDIQATEAWRLPRFQNSLNEARQRAADVTHISHGRLTAPISSQPCQSR